MNQDVQSLQATIFFCHGSRDPRWREPFEQLAAAYQSRLPQQQVRLAFLELMEPGLAEVLAELVDGGVTRARIVPLFLAPGAHTRRDLPALVAEAQLRFRQLEVEVLPALLESDALRSAVVDALLPGSPSVITWAHNVTPTK